MSRKVTDKDINYIISNMDCMERRKIAKTLGLSETTVLKIIKKNGGALEYHASGDVAKYREQYILKHYPDNVSTKIATELGISKPRVLQIARKLGVKHSHEFEMRRSPIGKKYGRLTVIKLSKILPNKARVYECLCDCGNTYYAKHSDLLSGVKSCGCIKKERHEKKVVNTRLYRIWSCMKQRCYNPKATKYNDYGDRGISVCDLWRNSFEEFKSWAMNNGYEDNLEIDRINNDGNYCPENCRWVTHIVQCNNTRKNRWIIYKNQKKTIAQWSRELNIPYHTLRAKIRKGEFPPKDI